MEKRGRKEIDPNEKKTLVRVWTKKSTIDLLGEAEIIIELNKKINEMHLLKSNLNEK